METNDVKTISITREHDKLCILEKLLNNDIELETIVSNYIDYSINKDGQNKIRCYHLLKEKIKDVVLLAKIIQLCSSIIYDKSFEIIIHDNMNSNEIDNIHTYLNNPYIPLFNTYFISLL